MITTHYDPYFLNESIFLNDRGQHIKVSNMIEIVKDQDQNQDQNQNQNQNQNQYIKYIIGVYVDGNYEHYATYSNISTTDHETYIKDMLKKYGIFFNMYNEQIYSKNNLTLMDIGYEISNIAVKELKEWFNRKN